MLILGFFHFWGPGGASRQKIGFCDTGERIKAARLRRRPTLQAFESHTPRTVHIMTSHNPAISAARTRKTHPDSTLTYGIL